MTTRFCSLSIATTSSRRNCAGFTLVELVSVILIIGILAAVLIPRFTGRITYDTRGYADQVLGALQYAQKAAVAERRNVCVFVTSGAVSLSKSASAGAGVACTGALLDPTTGAPFSVAAPAGVTLASSWSPVIFDALGQNVNATGAPQTANATVTITGDFSTTINVEKITGYVR